MRNVRALLIRALFSHLWVAMHTPSFTLEEQANTLKLIKRLRMRQGLTPMTPTQIIDYLHSHYRRGF